MAKSKEKPNETESAVKQEATHEGKSLNVCGTVKKSKSESGMCRE